MTRPTLSREEVFEILDGVLDPEVPVLSVVELGIVRDVLVDEPEGGVTVVVTPTYTGCPAVKVIEADIVAALEARGLAPVRVRTVYSPPWTTDWIGETAKEKLRAYGIAPPAPAEADDLVPLMRRRPPVPCPYCGSRDTELRSEFGSTACKAICYCNGCRQPFESFKSI